MGFMFWCVDGKIFYKFSSVIVEILITFKRFLMTFYDVDNVDAKMCYNFF
jgi:hypothetical protein